MQELFSFDGRINRKTFWFRGIIILILIGVVYAVMVGLDTAISLIGLKIIESTGRIECSQNRDVGT